jgi:hypothetical protein
LAVVVLTVPHAGRVASARGLSTVLGETRGRPAARRIVLSRVTIPVALTIIVTRDFSLPVVASTSAVVVVVHDSAPLRPRGVAHVAKSLVGFTTRAVVQVGTTPRTVGENPGDRVGALRA